MSLQIFLFYKFFCTNISQVELEILRNSSTIFRSSHWRCSIKKLFSNILWYSQKNTCVGVSFLIKLQIIRPVTLLKRLQYWYFLANIWKCIRRPIFEELLRKAAFLEVLWERFSDQKLPKGTIDDILYERLLKLVKIEQKYFLK